MTNLMKFDLTCLKCVPVFQCVDAVRASAKLELLGESGGTLTSSGELVLDLGRALYKLHFQLVMVLEAANRMVGALSIAAETNQVATS